MHTPLPPTFTSSHSLLLFLHLHLLHHTLPLLACSPDLPCLPPHPHSVFPSFSSATAAGAFFDAIPSSPLTHLHQFSSSPVISALRPSFPLYPSINLFVRPSVVNA